MDLVVRVDELPRPGETRLGGAFFTAAGGKGANQAVAAARLGASVRLVGCVGADSYGEQLLGLAAADGVDVAALRVVDGPSGVALILVDSRGQNAIAVAPGANARLAPEHVAETAPVIRAADVLVAQLEVPLEALLAAGQIARAAGVPFILNAAPMCADLGPLLALTDVLVVNETELGQLTGRPVAPGTELEAAGIVRASGLPAVVVTLGERGAAVLSDREAVLVPSFPVQVVDSTAAGDAFVGALASAYRPGVPLAEAARVGCAAGALACTRSGAQPSLPQRTAVSDLLARSGGAAVVP